MKAWKAIHGGISKKESEILWQWKEAESREDKRKETKQRREGGGVYVLHTFTNNKVIRLQVLKYWSIKMGFWKDKKEEKKESKQKEGEEGDDDECEKRGKELKIKTFHLPNIFLLSTWFLFF